MTENLRLFAMDSGGDLVIAVDRDDAIAVWKAYYDDDLDEYEEQMWFMNLEAIPDNHLVTIFQHNSTDIIWPANAQFCTANHYGDSGYKIQATARDWITANGRRWLAVCEV